MEETHLLALMPTSVTQTVSTFVIPINLYYFDLLVKSTSAGEPIRVNEGIAMEHGRKTNEKFRWVLLTRDLFPGSRNQSFVDQKQLLEQYGYTVPALLDTISVIHLEWLCFGKRLFCSNNPWTETRCQETVHGIQVIVGFFNHLGGLSVQLDYSRGISQNIGIAGLLNL